MYYAQSYEDMPLNADSPLRMLGFVTSAIFPTAPQAGIVEGDGRSGGGVQ